MLCPTSNQHFLRIKWHSKQKPFIFGILSRGDLCMDNQILGCLPYTASTASYLKDAIFLIIQWRKTCLLNFFKLKWYLYNLNDIFHSILFHGLSFLLNSEIHWFLRCDLWGRFEVVWGHISKCSQMVWIPFSYSPIVKMTKKLPPWAQRLIWRLLRLGLVNDWISRLMHKFHH